MAQAAADAIGAASILVIPAAANPQRTDAPRASAEHRLAMTQIAFRNEPRARVLDIEMTAARPSYTIDTVRTLAERGAGPMRLLIGGDQALNFPTWREWRDLAALAEPLIVIRAPYDRARFAEALHAAFGVDGPAWLHRVVPVDPSDVSATAVRSDIAATGRSDDLDDEVSRYIRDHALYRQSNSHPMHDAPPPPLTTTETRAPNGWLVQRNAREVFGPYSATELRQHISAGRLDQEDLVRRESGPPAPPAAWRPWRECLGELESEAGVPPTTPPTAAPAHPPPPAPAPRYGALEFVIPIGRHPVAIFAPYAGLLGLGCALFAPVGIVLGILAWRWTPQGRPGRGRAVVAIVLSLLGIAWNVPVVLSML